MGAKPYTMDDVQAWVEMLWERERLDEMTMARIRATVEECDALKAQVEAARRVCINTMALGTIGAYIACIFDEVKQRPLYVVRQNLGRSTGADPL